MTFLIFRKRNESGFARYAHVSCRRENTSQRWSTSTAHILQRLTMFAVNTGIWTATFAVLAIIMVRVIHH